MFDRDKLKIFVMGIKNNEHGILWTKGGVILIDDETVTLKYLGTLAVFDRKTVNYYRETDGTVIFGKASQERELFMQSYTLFCWQSFSYGGRSTMKVHLYLF